MMVFRCSILFFSLIFSVWSCIAAPTAILKKVNLFSGTAGDNGQVDPGAAVPFGMVRVCPDSDPRSHAGYDFAVTRVSGISINRLSGVGCSGAGGNLSIKPAGRNDELHIVKSTEKAWPGYYETTFDNGVRAGLTATVNTAVEQFMFPENSKKQLTVNFGASFERISEEWHRVISDREIEGFISAPNVCGRGQYRLYFYLNTSEPFQIQSDKDKIAELVFNGKKNKPVEVRITVSSVDLATARNEQKQLSKTNFSRLVKMAGCEWEKVLSTIEVEGNKAEQTLFYTLLYRVYLSPAVVSSADGKYFGTDGQIHETHGTPYYSSWSLWDTYRTKFPLLCLLSPDKMSHISQSLVRLYQTGKENWSTRNEATPTVRTEHAGILLLDAYRKGIKNIRFADCYEALCREAAVLPMNSPDQKLEATADLWAMAQIAEILGKKTDAEKYASQSAALFKNTWQKEFMNIDHAYSKMSGNGLYQGTRWQYRWAVPQYLKEMDEWAGGKDTLLAQLTRFFDQSLYNQGNEPDIHVPFLFNRLGAPQKTSETVHSLLTGEILHKYGGNSEFKTPYFGRAFKNAPEGFMPEMDEDDGTMGAWFVFGASGLYPLIVGEELYEISSPIFDKIRIKPENGKTFSIRTTNRKKLSDPIKSIYLNGRKYDSWQISHSIVRAGGVLELRY